MIYLFFKTFTRMNKSLSSISLFLILTSQESLCYLIPGSPSLEASERKEGILAPGTLDRGQEIEAKLFSGHHIGAKRFRGQNLFGANVLGAQFFRANNFQRQIFFKLKFYSTRRCSPCSAQLWGETDEKILMIDRNKECTIYLSAKSN